MKLEMRNGVWELRTMHERLLERSDSRAALVNTLRSHRYGPDRQEPRHWYRLTRKRKG